MLIDSNVIIYASQPEYSKLRSFLGKQKLDASVISKIETLGYNRLTSTQKTLLENFFDSIVLVELEEEIVDKAIQLRQTKNIALADAIIAATAVIYKIPLATKNTQDFKGIQSLRLIDPLK